MTYEQVKAIEPELQEIAKQIESLSERIGVSIHLDTTHFVNGDIETSAYVFRSDHGTGHYATNNLVNNPSWERR